jgi:DNA invertase Pin-like site-specific DNA recombinase
MPANPHAEAARAEALGRLAAYREAHAALHADIRRAAALGLTKTEIAAASGLTRQGVGKILNRPESPRG